MPEVKTQCACCAKELKFVSIEEFNANLDASDAPEILCLQCRPQVVVKDVR